MREEDEFCYEDKIFRIKFLMNKNEKELSEEIVRGVLFVNLNMEVLKNVR
jgi:hypothetical protein